MAGPVLGCQVHESVRRHINLITNYYEQLLEAGVCREQARGLLPQSMYTEYYGTANLNNILKFVDLRIHEGAQVEIQKVAKAILQITRELYPITVGAYEKAKNI
jgi:thymidylate synthase (FAD)